MGTGMLVAVALMFFARPLGVLLCLLPFKMPVQEKAMVAWVGLRGAVPVILATFPWLAGLPQAHIIFNIVFFVVLTSVLIQGTSISFVSRRLKVDVPAGRMTRNPLAMEYGQDIDAELTDVIVPYNSAIVGKRVFEIGVPERCLIVLISRDDKFIIPNGSSVIEEGDVLQVLASREDIAALRDKVEKIS
jgi:cell volume regulation protein A